MSDSQEPNETDFGTFPADTNFESLSQVEIIASLSEMERSMLLWMTVANGGEEVRVVCAAPDTHAEWKRLNGPEAEISKEPSK